MTGAHVLETRRFALRSLSILALASSAPRLTPHMRKFSPLSPRRIQPLVYSLLTLFTRTLRGGTLFSGE